MRAICPDRSAFFAAVLLATALFSFLGCYVKVGDEKYGMQDTAFPWASYERGCVVKMELLSNSSSWVLGEYSIPEYNVLFNNLHGSESFWRYAGVTADFEIGKCYEWKLGYRDAWRFEDMKKVASDTIREIKR